MTPYKPAKTGFSHPEAVFFICFTRLPDGTHIHMIHMKKIMSVKILLSLPKDTVSFSPYRRHQIFCSQLHPPNINDNIHSIPTDFFIVFIKPFSSEIRCFRIIGIVQNQLIYTAYTVFLPVYYTTHFIMSCIDIFP